MAKKTNTTASAANTYEAFRAKVLAHTPEDLFARPQLLLELLAEQVGEKKLPSSPEALLSKTPHFDKDAQEEIRTWWASPSALASNLNAPSTSTRLDRWEALATLLQQTDALPARFYAWNTESSRRSAFGEPLPEPVEEPTPTKGKKNAEEEPLPVIEAAYYALDPKRQRKLYILVQTALLALDRTVRQVNEKYSYLSTAEQEFLLPVAAGIMATVSATPLATATAKTLDKQVHIFLNSPQHGAILLNDKRYLSQLVDLPQQIYLLKGGHRVEIRLDPSPLLL